MKSCAILSMDCLDDFEVYDHLIEKPLLDLGWQTELVSWRANDINWNNYDVVLIRTPWDYQDDAEGFLAVLAKIEESTAQLENSLSTVKWNINKKYLKQLNENGVSIVPTIWQEYFQTATLLGAFEHFNTHQLVVKPCVSANADNTFWLTKDNVEEYLQELELVFAHRDFMIQPFMEHIVSEGEFSLFYFNGEYSHAILKTPKDNDFRVQEEHGGRLTAIEPELKLQQQAAHAITQLPELPMYARVDFVRMNDEFAMMEAELIEPSLYFNMDEQSPIKFAKAFVDKVSG